MKKIVISLLAVALGASALFAQSTEERPTNPFWIGVQGGGLLSYNENCFSYREAGKAVDLLSLQGSVSVGYDVTRKLGFRLNVNYDGKNDAANNTRQTSAGGFWPYNFKSISAFIDATWNLTDEFYEGPFAPKAYIGVGLGHSYDMTDSGHPWQTGMMTDPNNSFGFRVGFLCELRLSDVFGVFADFAAEAYTDNFNGLQPTKEEKKNSAKGYPGYPFDLRGVGSFGLALHF